MPVENAREFWTIIESTEIVDPTVLRQLEEKHQKLEDPKQIAGQLVRENVLTRWQAKFVLSGRTQLRIGNFVLLDRISRDSLGDRFLALHEQLDREVELQLLPTGLSEHKDFVEGFLAQSRQSAKLDHPNIVHVYDIDQEKGRYYLVTEKVEGEPLDQTNGSVLNSTTRVAEIVRDLAEAVRYAHQNNVIHGSITKNNLLIGSDLKIKLRNIALSKAERLSDQDGDEYGLTSSRETDEDAVFDIAGELFNSARQLNEPSTQNLTGDRSTKNTKVTELLELTDRCRSGNGDQRLGHLAAALGSWLEENQAGPNLPALPVSGSTDPQQPENATSANQDDPKSRSQGKVNLPWVSLAISAAGIVIIGFGLAFMYGGDNHSSEKTDLEKAADENKKARAARYGDSSDLLPESPLNSGAKQNTSNGQGSSDDANKDDSTKNQNPVGNPSQQNSDQVENKDNKPADNTTPVSNKSAANDQNKVPKKDDPKENKPPANANDAKKDSGQGNGTKSDANASKNGDTSDPDPGNKKEEELPKPFSKLAERVALPDNAESKAVLGQVFTGKKYLLAMNLVTHRSISKSKLSFSMVRDKSDRQKWNVMLSPRKDELVAVAEFHLTENDLTFRWLPGAEQADEAKYLQNCVLELETRGEKKKVYLRKPVLFDAVVLTKDRPEVKTDLPLTWLPQQSAIAIEWKPFGKDQFPEHVVFDERTKVGGRKEPVVIMLHREEDLRYSWVRIESTISGKIKINTKLQIQGNSPSSPKTWSEKQFGRQVNALEANAMKIKRQLEVLQAYNPPHGQITKTRDAIKEVSKQLESANRYFNAAKSFQEEIIPAVLDKPFQFEIYYEFDGNKILLGKTKAP